MTSIFYGEGSIDKAILSQKSLLLVGEKISGRTLYRNAKTVLWCNCKKMMAIVKGKGSIYRDGKFPSGTNWEDYILWCLIDMGMECHRAEAEKIDSVVVVATKNSDVVKGEKANGARRGDVGFLVRTTTSRMIHQAYLPTRGAKIQTRRIGAQIRHSFGVVSAFLRGPFGDMGTHPNPQ
ncbi:hypothetical protein MHU86_11428 [Fragilaria crotonensis]|nr:hypothetical protein MHU86_11428 [Fragilaria crotonensis]